MKDDINTLIGKWLREKREEKHMTGQEVADALGVTKTAVSYWESGKRTIYAYQMMDYCKAVGADPEELVRTITRKEKTNG